MVSVAVGQHLLDDPRALIGDLLRAWSTARSWRYTDQVVQTPTAAAAHHDAAANTFAASRRMSALGRIDPPHLGAQQQVCERAVAGVPQRPQPADEERRGVQQVSQVAGEQPPDPGTGRRSRRCTTRIPNSARPRLHPVIAGSNQRFSRISRRTTAPRPCTPATASRAAKRCGQVRQQRQHVAITATPSSTSSAERARSRAPGRQRLDRRRHR